MANTRGQTSCRNKSRIPSHRSPVLHPLRSDLAVVLFLSFIVARRTLLFRGPSHSKVCAALLLCVSPVAVCVWLG